MSHFPKPDDYSHNYFSPKTDLNTVWKHTPQVIQENVFVQQQTLDAVTLLLRSQFQGLGALGFTLKAHKSPFTSISTDNDCCAFAPKIFGAKNTRAECAIMKSSVAKDSGGTCARHCGLIGNGRSQVNRDCSCVRNMDCCFACSAAASYTLVVKPKGHS